MIFHMSISADDPARVAGVLAELWGGEVHPFPPVAKGALIVMAGDARNSAVEVYPHGTELHPVEGDADAEGRPNPASGRMGATHMAIATVLEVQAVLAIAEREGWLAKYRKRGGMFGVIEFWLENTLMVEILTEDMVGEYLSTMTPMGWRAALAAGAPQLV